MKTDHKTPIASVSANQSNTVKYVIIGIVVLAVLGYGASYMMRMTAVSVMNAELKANGVEVTGNPAAGNATYNFKDQNGNEVTVGSGTKLPDDFPSNIPLYKGTIITSTSATESGKKMYAVSLQTSDAFDKVLGYYKNELSSGGWKIIQEANVAAGYTMYAAENGTEQLSVMVQNADGKMTMVTLTTGTK